MDWDNSGMAFNMLHDFSETPLSFLPTFQCIPVLFLEYVAKSTVIEMIDSNMSTKFHYSWTIKSNIIRYLCTADYTIDTGKRVVILVENDITYLFL